MSKRILVISPHVDDVELAAGASVARWVAEGNEVFYTALSDCRDTLAGTAFPEDALQQECYRALGILGIPQEKIFIFSHTNKHYYREARAIFEDLETLRESIKPDLVVIPTPTDTHQDHKTVAKQAISVFRRSTSIIAYEQPWNTTEFMPNFFVRLESQHVEKKLAALAEYKTQHEFQRSYLDPEFLRGWSRTRGMHVNAQYAEAYHVFKWID